MSNLLRKTYTDVCILGQKNNFVDIIYHIHFMGQIWMKVLFYIKNILWTDTYQPEVMNVSKTASSRMWLRIIEYNFGFQLVGQNSITFGNCLFYVRASLFYKIPTIILLDKYYFGCHTLFVVWCDYWQRGHIVWPLAWVIWLLVFQWKIVCFLLRSTEILISVATLLLTCNGMKLLCQCKFTIGRQLTTKIWLGPHFFSFIKFLEA